MQSSSATNGGLAAKAQEREPYDIESCTCHGERYFEFKLKSKDKPPG
jgi:hypothetical protein